MNHYCRFISKNEDQEEPLYFAGPQDPSDIICDGSDSERTTDQISQKHRRYEEVARRLLSGHRPFIQSASLRGPLGEESGWVNPWRCQSQREEDWWQPGSEDMLFTRENVLRRAADHGLGYLSAKEALAWCRAAAEAEAQDQFDSLDVAHFPGTPNSGNEDSFTQDLRAKHDRERTSSHSYVPVRQPSTKATLTDASKNYETANSNPKDLKRPADTRWLKGSYVSKRARWEGTPQSSPTPLPDALSERDGRRRNSASRSASSQNVQRVSTSQPVTPWMHDAQLPRYTGSIAQVVQSKDGKRGHMPHEEDLDDVPENSQEETLVSTPEFHSASRGLSNSSMPKDHLSRRAHHDKPIMVASARNTSFDTPIERHNASMRKSHSSSNRLPVLPRDFGSHAEADLDGDISFVTEIVPSSRNLGKFQFRKKRRKTEKRQESFGHNDSHSLLQVSSRLPEPAAALMARDLTTQASSTSNIVSHVPVSISTGSEELDSKAFATMDQIQHPPERVLADVKESNDDCSANEFLPELLLESFKSRLQPGYGSTPSKLQVSRTTSSPEEAVRQLQTQMEMESTSTEAQDSEKSYFKKIALMSVNLPNLNFSSPFRFGSFSASKTTPLTAAAAGEGRAPQVSGALHNDLAQNRAEEFPSSTAKELNVLTDFDYHTATSRQLDDAVDEAGPLDVPDENEKETANDQDNMVLVDMAVAPPDPSGLEDDIFMTAISSSSKSLQKMSRSPLQSGVEDRQSPFTVGFSQQVDASTPQDVSPITHIASPSIGVYGISTGESGCKTLSPMQSPMQSPIELPKILPVKSPSKSQNTARTKGRPADMTQEVNFDDGTTQSFNTTPARSLNKQRMSPRFDPISHQRMDAEVALQPKGVVLNASSPHTQKSESSKNNESDKNISSPRSTSAVTELELAVREVVPVSDEVDQPPLVEDLDSWQGGEPQSPWVPETILPRPIAQNASRDGSPLGINQKSFLRNDRSTPNAEDSIEASWQHIEQAEPLENEGTPPIRDLTTHSSPHYFEAPSFPLEDGAELNTQQMFAAATNNPWQSSSKGSVSRKPTRRVSFGGVLSEEQSDSQLRVSDFSKQFPKSPPPPPSTTDRTIDEDAFDGELPMTSKFGNHFAAAARPKKRPLPTASGSLLSSPAVGAMAERFIAADQDIIVERERWLSLTETSTRHLQPKSDARNNLSPSPPGYNLDLNAFLGDAGEFLNEWSVDSEVKKVKDSKARKIDKSSASKRSGLFGVLNGSQWT